MDAVPDVASLRRASSRRNWRAAFVALTPTTTALLGIPVLGECPSAIDWIAITLTSVGVFLVSGGRDRVCR
jgi:drug/metabolite transporter (DMT)-like permease